MNNWSFPLEQHNFANESKCLILIIVCRGLDTLNVQTDIRSHCLRYISFIICHESFLYQKRYLFSAQGSFVKFKPFFQNRGMIYFYGDVLCLNVLIEESMSGSVFIISCGIEKFSINISKVEQILLTISLKNCKFLYIFRDQRKLQVNL